jgi:hypothetical protein
VCALRSKKSNRQPCQVILFSLSPGDEVGEIWICQTSKPRAKQASLATSLSPKSLLPLLTLRLITCPLLNIPKMAYSSEPTDRSPAGLLLADELHSAEGIIGLT